MPLEPQDTAFVETAAAAATQSSASADARPARGDVATLLRQLAQQKEATTRALESTMAIEKQLAQTREQLNRALMIAAIPPDPPPKSGKEDEPESPGLRANQELENERKARVDERVNAAAQIARLEETVAHAREKEKNALSSMKRARVLGVVIAVGLLLGAVLLTRLAARYPTTSVAQVLTSDSAPQSTPEAPAATPVPQPAAGGTEEQGSAKTSGAEDLAPQSSLENAVAEMHRALTAFPDSKPEEVIEALRAGSVKVDPSSCLLAWNDGQPELLVQDRRGDRVKIAETLTQCASAIERAHNGMILKSQAHP